MKFWQPIADFLMEMFTKRGSYISREAERVHIAVMEKKHEQRDAIDELLHELLKNNGKARSRR